MRIQSRAARRLAPALARLVVLTGTVLAPALARADVPTEKSLPPTTFFLLKVDNAEKLRESLTATQLGRLLADPAMQALKDDFTAKLEDPNQKLKEKIGVTLSDLYTLPQGEMSLALVARDDPKFPLAILLSADAGKNAKAMEEILDKSTKLAEDDNTVTAETFKGLRLTIITPKKKDEDKPEQPLIWARQGDVFHIASDLDALKDVLSNTGGRPESLASSESFATVQKKVGEDAQLLWYIDAAQFLKLIIQSIGAQGGGNAQQIEGQLQITGLNNLKALGGSVAFGVGDFDQLAKIYLYSPGPSQGLLKIFSTPKADLRPQPWVPASVAQYWSISWDLDNAYTAFSDFVDMFQPGALAKLEEALAGAGGGEGLSFQKDLFGPLGNRITILSDYKKPTGATPAKPDADDDDEDNSRTLMAFALDDPKAFQNTFNKILAIAKQSPKKREFQGTTIYDFEVPELPNAPSTGLKGPVSVAIAKNQLFVAFEPSFLEQILRSGGTPLSDDAEYQAVVKQFPDQTMSFSYQEPEQQARTLYDLIKKGKLKQVLQQKNENGPDLSKAADLIDPKKLPEFSVFSKYLSQGGGYGTTDDEGVSFTSFTIKK